MEISITMKTTFEKAKDMPKLACSSRERATTNEGGSSPLPPPPSCGEFKKENNEKGFNTQPAPLFRRSGKPFS
jgi:hypothetical protein